MKRKKILKSIILSQCSETSSNFPRYELTGFRIETAFPKSVFPLILFQVILICFSFHEIQSIWKQ